MSTTESPPRPTPGQQIYDAIKTQILDGVYAPGAPIPATRSLAAELGVSRTTVTAAYERLQAEGYLESRQGARTTVARALQAAPTVRPLRPTPPATRRLSRFGTQVAAFPLPVDHDPAGLIADFRYGHLATDDFPTLGWRRALNAALLRRQPRLAYGDPQGAPELRSALQGYLWRARGLRCTAAQIIVVNGSQQGLDVCARLLLDAGDTVAIEAPCYPSARQVFTAAGARCMPIPVDDEGLRTDRLAGLRARLAYVTPSHQFPLGAVMSVARRQALLAWARDGAAWVVEDDYDGEYRYDTRPVPTLHSMDGAAGVIYVGTVSKTLSPQLRLGYLVVPAELAPVFAAAKRLTDRHSPGLEQRALASFIDSGAYERHVRRARRRNARRRAATLAAVARHLGERVTVTGAAAGLHVVLWFHAVPAAREAALIAAARAAGVGIYPITPLYDGATGRPDMAGIVLGYASLDEASIKRGIARLAEVLKKTADGP